MQNKKIIKKILAFTFALTVGCVALAGLSACQGFGLSQNDINKASSTAYLTEINKITKEFGNTLSDFQNCIKEKDVNGMKDKVDFCQTIIDDFNKVEAPENCKAAQKSYSDAFLQLQQALKDYTQIYKDFSEGTQPSNVLQQRIVKVQESYNQGMELLKKADEEASKIEQ